MCQAAPVPRVHLAGGAQIKIVQFGDPFTVGEDYMLLSGGGVNYWHSVIASELDRLEEGMRVWMEKNETKK